MDLSFRAVPDRKISNTKYQMVDSIFKISPDSDTGSEYCILNDKNQNSLKFIQCMYM